MALSTHPTTIVNNRFERSSLAENSWQHLRDGRALWADAKVEKEAVLMIDHIFLFETRISPDRAPGEDLNAATESAVPNSIECYIVTMSLSCLVFDIWPRDGHRKDRRRQLWHIWPLRRTSINAINITLNTRQLYLLSRWERERERERESRLIPLTVYNAYWL